MLTHNPLKYKKAETMENKHKEGAVVYANEDLTKKLVIRRYVDRIYYCKVEGDPSSKELVYFERELVNEERK